MTWKEYAKVAYDAYGNYRAWKTYDDKLMPQWSNLTPAIQEAWVVAIKAFLDKLQERMKLLDE